MKLFCSDCSKLVDVVAVSGVCFVQGACDHKVAVKRVPFKDAKRGVELCLDSAKSLVQAAQLLSANNDDGHAFFLLLTAYEEMAKCSRILDAAAQNSVSQNDLLVEESLFRQHETKYRITMDYLDYWIPMMDELRRKFEPPAVELDTEDFKADRQEIREHGFEVRMSCLYVDYANQWIDRHPIPKEKVNRNLQMIKSMIRGYENSVKNWEGFLSYLKR